jgi:hypothetical protein
MNEKLRMKMNEKLYSDSLIDKFILFLLGLLIWIIPICVLIISQFTNVSLELSNYCLFPVFLVIFFILILIARNGWDADLSRYYGFGNITGNIILKIFVVSIIAIVGLLPLMMLNTVDVGCGIIFLVLLIPVFNWTARGTIRLYNEPPGIFNWRKNK